MRKVQNQQLKPGELAIKDIQLDPKSRDDIVKVLLGLQHLYTKKKKKLFKILKKHFRPKTDHDTGRPGMDIWNIFVLGVLKQGMGCDLDRIHNLANSHREVREMMGHDSFVDHTYYELQTIAGNISLLSEEMLQEINQLVVKEGHTLVGKKSGEALRGRCDSFVVETDVHYPTDVSLLWDSMRCMIRHAGGVAKKHKITGWRQWKKLMRKVRSLYNCVSTRGRRSKKRVEAYLAVCRELVVRIDGMLVELQLRYRKASVCHMQELHSLLFFKAYAEKFIDQVDRRLLKGEKIPQQEKIFSIFEEHTRWCAKGKAGKPVELGVPVCIVEDQHQFILHHKVMFTGQDVDVAVPIIEETRERYSDLRVCSFDRGFHSPENRERLDKLLVVNALPRKGRLNKADQALESEEEFVEARRQHPAVESAINALDHRGLDRVRTHGALGFARTVALSILASNFHQLGRLLQSSGSRRKELRRAA